MQLAANLTWLYPDLDWADRFAAAAADGFAGAEILRPYDHAPAWYAEQLRRSGLELVLFNMPSGDGPARSGWAALPGAEDGFRRAFDEARAVADATGCRRIHVTAGDVSGHAADAWRAALLGNLEHALRLADGEDLTLTLEALNRDDKPGYAYHRPGEVVDILRRVDSPRLRLQFDYYHCAKEGLDPAAEVQAAAAWIGHAQIAGVNGRSEPDLGRPDLLEAVAMLPALGYDGWLGCEYRPRTTAAAGLGWCEPLRAAGVLRDRPRAAPLDASRGAR